MDKNRLAALATLAATRKDADLARLSATSARLNAAIGLRDAMEAALAREILLATAQPDVPGLRALDSHVLLAEQARTRLEHAVARVTAERDGIRDECALSFGRALILARLRDAQHAERRRKLAKAAL